jgi:hypothetical protein
MEGIGREKTDPVTPACSVLQIVISSFFAKN